MKYLLNEYFFSWAFSKVATLTYLVPLVAFLISLNRKKTSVQASIVQFALFVLLLEYVASNRDLTATFLNKTNYPVYHIGTLGLIGLIFKVYRQHLIATAGASFFWLLLLGHWAVFFWNMVWGDGFMNFPSLSAGLYSLTGILLGISYLYRLLTTMEVSRLEKDPLFLATAGFLIYYSGNLLLWIFLTYFNTLPQEEFFAIYRVNGVLTIFLNVMLSVAILTKPTNKTTT